MDFTDWSRAEGSGLDDLAQAIFWLECVEPKGNLEEESYSQAKEGIALLIMSKLDRMGANCTYPWVALVLARKYLVWKDWRPGQEGDRPDTFVPISAKATECTVI